MDLRPPIVIYAVVAHVLVGGSGALVGGTFLGAGLALVVAAIGLWRRQSWGWLLAVIFDGIGLLVLGICIGLVGLDPMFVTGVVIWSVCLGLAILARPSRAPA